MHFPKFNINPSIPLDPHTIPPTSSKDATPPLYESLILNLSATFHPTTPQISLLEKGLTFIPHNNRINKQELNRDIHNYHRRLKLIDHFSTNNTHAIQPFTTPSTWEPSHIHTQLNTLIHKDKKSLTHFLNISSQPSHTNLTPAEQQAIIQFQQNKSIIIKPADKGSKIVILDTHHYLLEANRQLSDTKYYQPIQQTVQITAQTQLHQLINSLHQLGYINTKQKAFLYGPNPPRSRQFYLLPKIHKPSHTWTIPSVLPQGRPIVSDCNSISHNVSIFIDHFLNPLSTKHPSYIKDTYHFLEKIHPLTVPKHTLLFTLDVENLYTNIHTPTGIQAVRKLLHQNPDPTRPDNILLQLLEICLTHNDFLFDDQFYLQIHGTAMGQRFAPSYANVYMSDWEHTALPKSPLQPYFFYRYLDDIIGAWTHSITDFHHFLDILNSHHPSVKLKATIHPDEVNFLDTTVFFTPISPNHKKFSTKVFFKPTDTHSLLHKTSNHPKHTFKGIIKSQIIRYYRICSFQSDLDSAISELFKALRHRHYSKRFLRQIKTETLQDLTHNSPNTPRPHTHLIPLITKFSQPMPLLHRKLKNNFTTFSKQHPTFQDYTPISAYKRNRNLKDMLTKSTFTRHHLAQTPEETPHFSPHTFISNPYTTLSAPSNPLNLDSINLVYAITCTQCNIIYVGQTKNTLRQRLKQHLYNIQKNNLNSYLVKHFQIHKASNLRITGLESNLLWSTPQRKRIELSWIKKLNTWFPNGLNEKE